MTNNLVIKNPNWWRRRTALEKKLILISAIVSLIIVAFIISLVYVISNHKDNNQNVSSTAEKFEALKITANELNNDKICLTSNCVHSASDMIRKIDYSINPCDDFYNFACGKFIAETLIPDEEVSVDTFSNVDNTLNQQLLKLVSEEIKETEIKPFKLAKKMYKACMNQELIEERGIQPLLDIHEKLGGWPVIKGDSWDEENWTWIKTVQNFRKIGYSIDYIFDLSVEVDSKNSSQRTLDIDQSALGLGRTYLLKGFNSTFFSAHYKYMVDIAVLYGAERTRAEKELKEALEFEVALANISLPNEKRRNATALYNLMTIKEVQEKYPFIQWLEYLNSLLVESSQATEDDQIVVAVPDFFKALGPLLAKTPKRTIANYMIWRITGFSSYFMTKAIRKRQNEYANEVSGTEDEEPRWKECVDIVTGSVPIAVGALYIRKHFQKESKVEALDMVNRIKGEFEKTLRTVEWMDETTRKKALEKLGTMTIFIGYPDELMEDEKLIEYYKDLEFDETKYLETILNLNVFSTDLALEKLRKPVEKGDWKTHGKPAVVNAYYSSIENSIQFPAGILQGHFFAGDRPRYMNYGAIGYVIGHEITHGFDDQGRQFDASGNLVDWWEKDTADKFLEKAKCIIDQYGNYTEPSVNMTLNGINTQGENTADNGGVKTAYKAYRNWVADHGPEPKLPGLKYTPEQLFWISAAQNWCAVQRTEILELRIITGVHAPNHFRVLGPFGNNKDFSKDFNCPLGSTMNPVHKCEVW